MALRPRTFEEDFEELRRRYGGAVGAQVPEGFAVASNVRPVDTAPRQMPTAEAPVDISRSAPYLGSISSPQARQAAQNIRQTAPVAQPTSLQEMQQRYLTETERIRTAPQLTKQERARQTETARTAMEEYQANLAKLSETRDVEAAKKAEIQAKREFEAGEAEKQRAADLEKERIQAESRGRVAEVGAEATTGAAEIRAQTEIEKVRQGREEAREARRFESLENFRTRQAEARAQEVELASQDSKFEKNLRSQDVKDIRTASKKKPKDGVDPLVDELSYQFGVDENLYNALSATLQEPRKRRQLADDLDFAIKNNRTEDQILAYLTNFVNP